MTDKTPNPTPTQVAKSILASDLSPHAKLCGVFVACAAVDGTCVSVDDIVSTCDVCAVTARRALDDLTAHGFATLCEGVAR